MRIKFIGVIFCVAFLISAKATFAADTNSLSKDLKELVSRINTKLQANQKSEKDLANELKEFDALLARYKGGDAEEMTQVLAMKADLYLQVLEQPEKAGDVLRQIHRDYPQTKIGQRSDEILRMLTQQTESKKVQDSLVVGKIFPDFAETDLAGKPLSVGKFKGKIVLVDFWATWCGPCVMELPQVIEVYQKHHKDGFEIIGISLDTQRPRLESFLKEKNMSWPQFFDGLQWKNKLAVKYGVNSIPATYLLDGEGKILAKNLRGEELESAVTAALKKK